MEDGVDVVIYRWPGGNLEKIDAGINVDLERGKRVKVHEHKVEELCNDECEVRVILLATKHRSGCTNIKDRWYCAASCPVRRYYHPVSGLRISTLTLKGGEASA